MVAILFLGATAPFAACLTLLGASAQVWADPCEEFTLLASDGAQGDEFGCSVSVSGDVALVGARDNLSGAGSAYVYRWNGSSWGQEAKLLAADVENGDFFGHSVSVSGDVAVVGAHGDDNDNGYSSGSAYVYHWDGSSWVQAQKLLASDGTAWDYFGYSVSVCGDVVVVGASYYAIDIGSAYVFPCLAPCPWDIAGPGGGPPDGVVAINDFLELLATWGCVGCPADFLDPPGVGYEDVQFLIDNWGTLCAEGQGAQPPPLPEEVEDAGLVWPDDWNTFVNCITSGTPEQQANCVCWLGCYLQAWPCADCPGDDPFGAPSDPPDIVPDQPDVGSVPSPGWTTGHWEHQSR